mgnify:FL=1
MTQEGETKHYDLEERTSLFAKNVIIFCRNFKQDN